MRDFEITRRTIRPGSIAEKLVDCGTTDGEMPILAFIASRPRLNNAFKLLRRLEKERAEQSQEHDADQRCDDGAAAVHSSALGLNANRFANECNDNPDPEQRAAQATQDGS